MEKCFDLKVTVQPYRYTYDENLVENIHSSEKFVSDGIGDNYKHWNPNTPIFLSSQTGSGKNTFIENKIIPFALEMNKKVLLISNRIACNIQIKRRLCELNNCESYLIDYTLKGLIKVENFNNTKVISYQKLWVYLNKIDQLNILKSYDYVVFDEAHYFYADSYFNSNTNALFNKALQSFINSTRVYLSSTPDEIFPLISKKESEIGLTTTARINHMNFPILNGLETKKLFYYDFKRNYEYIDTFYFTKKDELIKEIKDSNPNSKWIIFISSIRTGQELKELIGTDAVLITSNSKSSKYLDGKIYSQIVTDENFDCRILITTTVLDNGINLVDSSLNNMVIFTYDKTEFIQMIGRKRLLKNERLNLYLYSQSCKNFNGKLSLINSNIEAINTLNSNKSEFFNRYFNREPYLFKGLFLFNKYGHAIINQITHQKIFSDKNFYERMLNEFHIGNKQAFILEQLSWLGLEDTYSEKNYCSYISPDDAINKLIDFLDNKCNIPLSEDAFIIFSKELKAIGYELYGKQNSDRNDRNYGLNKIRKFFIEHNLRYKLSCKNKIYILEKL